MMKTWFSRVAAIAPLYSAPMTIAFDWVINFPRAKDVYEQLLKDAIWLNEPAQIEICRMLQRKGLLGTAELTFGDLTRPVAELDDDYINKRAVTGNQLDDLTAALGGLNFRVVVAGPSAQRGRLMGSENPRCYDTTSPSKKSASTSGIHMISKEINFSGGGPIRTITETASIT